MRCTVERARFTHCAIWPRLKPSASSSSARRIAAAHAITCTWVLSFKFCAPTACMRCPAVCSAILLPGLRFDTGSPRCGTEGCAIKAAASEAGELRELPVSVIKPNPGQPRTKFDPEALNALAASIEASGIVQPLLVRPLADGSYELVAGERRWRRAGRGRGPR